MADAMTPDPFPSEPNERTTMFHQQEGFYAERLSDGVVRLVKHESADPDSPVVMDHTIPAAEWASIVAAVSADGETSETYAAARGLHDA